jgi:2-polyprenyl-3-methyl-5-hydroxy-6-metoxy-1,4-benzoquinol methylase
MSKEVPTFEFGKNWERFIESHYSAEGLETSRQHLLKFLGLDSLEGKYFLDVGCGSGLHSLAAAKSGAARIVSLDVDEYSVKTTTAMRDKFGEGIDWQVIHGSALDPEFLATLDKPDILYSWGVLHHTGSMWEAIENTARLMDDHTVFYIALYTTTRKTPYWIDIKKEYNTSTALQKRWMEYRHVLRHRILPDLITLHNPMTYIREYKKKRGMEFMTDVRDWLGGWPYEDASIAEVLEFGRSRLGLELTRIATGESNTEYLFEKR